MQLTKRKEPLRIRIMQLVFIIIGIICILYGVCVLGTNSGTAFFAVWFVLGAVFIGLAVLAGLHIWEGLPKAVRIFSFILICALAVVFVFVEILIAGSFSSKGEKDLDYLIVLGAQVRENGPSVVLKYRLDAAYDYLTGNPKALCIVSGGQGSNEPFAEAEGMKRYLENRGIDAGRILIEDRSLNTKQNIDNCMEMIDPEEDRIGIVTNNFHVFRAAALAKKAGMKNVYGIAAGSSSLFLPNNMLREFFGVAKDVLAGNM